MTCPKCKAKVGIHGDMAMMRQEAKGLDTRDIMSRGKSCSICGYWIEVPIEPEPVSRKHKVEDNYVHDHVYQKVLRHMYYIHRHRNRKKQTSWDRLSTLLSAVIGANIKDRTIQKYYSRWLIENEKHRHAA